MVPCEESLLFHVATYWAGIRVFSLVQRREKHLSRFPCIFHLVCKSPAPNGNGSKTPAPNKWQACCMCVCACGECVWSVETMGGGGNPTLQMHWPWTSDPLLFAILWLFSILSTFSPSLPRTLQFYEHKLPMWEATQKAQWGNETRRGRCAHQKVGYNYGQRGFILLEVLWDGREQGSANLSGKNHTVNFARDAVHWTALALVVQT